MNAALRRVFEVPVLVVLASAPTPSHPHTLTPSLLASCYGRLWQIGVALPFMLFRQCQPRFQRRLELPGADFFGELMVLAGPTFVSRHTDLRRTVAGWLFVHEQLPFAVRSHQVQRKTGSL